MGGEEGLRKMRKGKEDGRRRRTEEEEEGK